MISQIRPKCQTHNDHANTNMNTDTMATYMYTATTASDNSAMIDNTRMATAQRATKNRAND